jgi:NAD(P)-dependent dehydrogenase (short-subunit alcohol dehydrogenase family)
MNEEAPDMTATPRVAVVTGGASGMGESTCHELGRRGHKVAVLDINEQAAQRVSEELRAEGVEAFGVAADVTDRPAVEEAFAKVRTELGPISILVTSAGMVGFGAFIEITPQDWSRIIDVNLNGTFHCCQVALPDMIAAKWGRIVMISSSSAQRGSPRMAHYAASKGAVITLTKSLANEYAPMGSRRAHTVERGDGQSESGGALGHRRRHRGGSGIFVFGRGRLHHRPGARGQRWGRDVNGRQGLLRRGRF